MKLWTVLLMLVVMVSCKNSTSNQSTELEEPDTCDCKELILDKDYNRFYLNDIKKPYTGTCTLIEKGILKSTRNFKEGKYHGDFIDYYDNGQIRTTIEYKEHFMNGNVKRYSEDGQLIGHTIYKQSRLIETKL